MCLWPRTCEGRKASMMAPTAPLRAFCVVCINRLRTRREEWPAAGPPAFEKKGWGRCISVTSSRSVLILYLFPFPFLFFAMSILDFIFFSQLFICIFCLSLPSCSFFDLALFSCSLLASPLPSLSVPYLTRALRIPHRPPWEPAMWPDTAPPS